MSKPANRLVVEDKLLEFPPSTGVRLILKDSMNRTLSIYSHMTVDGLMLKRGGSSTRRDQLRTPIRREVLSVLKASGSVAVEQV
jgi:hypothetical protein